MTWHNVQSINMCISRVTTCWSKCERLTHLILTSISVYSSWSVQFVQRVFGSIRSCMSSDWPQVKSWVQSLHDWKEKSWGFWVGDFYHLCLMLQTRYMPLRAFKGLPEPSAVALHCGMMRAPCFHKNDSDALIAAHPKADNVRRVISKIRGVLL